MERVVTLGVDPGTAICGYGAVLSEGDRLSMVACGAITTAPGQPMEARLQQVYRGLRDLMARYGPRDVAVEELFFSKNVRTALAVGQARGVVLLAAADAGLPVAEYTPLQVKQAVVGYGRAEKLQVQQMVRVILGTAQVPEPDDAADALAVAICHIHSSQSVERLGTER